MNPTDFRELLDVETVAQETHSHVVTTRRRLAAGLFGPPLRIGHRLFVRKKDFFAALDRFALAVPERAGSADELRADPRFVDMLRPSQKRKGAR